MGRPEPARHQPTDVPPVSLRERRRRELREQLSAVATRMFLERGFEAVTVAEVASACGVTEKTVFNHFPSKETLLIDRWDATIDALQERLADPGYPLVDAAVSVVEDELDHLTARGRASEHQVGQIRRFGALMRSSPALDAYRQRQLQRLTAAAMTTLVARLATTEDDCDAQITAEALTGLFAVFYRSLYRQAGHHRTARECRTAVRRDVRRAADRLRRGLQTT